jgi:uncharacterized protein YbbC (DUF1343 family)
LQALSQGEAMEAGLDSLLKNERLVGRLRGARLALLAHPASVTVGFTPILDALFAANIVPARLFGPEHGFGGEAQDMIGVGDAVGPRGIPVRSLYGSTFESLTPSAADLEGIELFVIDLQDVGARYYTFVWTALLACRACWDRGIPVLVLDRPNPLGQALRHAEGPVQDAHFFSFVGLEAVPVRHGLTLGELCAWERARRGVAHELLHVVGGPWPEVYTAASWRERFVAPSPNMPTFDTALVYPGGCLIEGTNLSEGRGTTRPFEWFGAPWLDGDRLARAFAALDLPGVVARPMSFLPNFHKHAGSVCGGVQVHVTDRETFRPYASYLALLAEVHHAHPERFAFRREAYEFVHDRWAFDLLTGSEGARLAILGGMRGAEIAATFGPVSETDRDVVRAVRSCLAR